MKHADLRTAAINGIIFLVAGGFITGLSIAFEEGLLLVLGPLFIVVGVICVMAVAESAREASR